MPLLSITQLAAVEALIAANLPERLAALEAARASRRKAARASYDRLHGQIAAVLDAHKGLKPMTAKRVVRALERSGADVHVSMRTVRRHMRSHKNRPTVVRDVDTATQNLAIEVRDQPSAEMHS